MRVERVIFLQGDSANEALEIFDNHGCEGALQYLADVHDIGEHEVFNELAHGSKDQVFYISDYVLSVNKMLGTIGLEYILDREGFNGK